VRAEEAREVLEYTRLSPYGVRCYYCKKPAVRFAEYGPMRAKEYFCADHDPPSSIIGRRGREDPNPELTAAVGRLLAWAFKGLYAFLGGLGAVMLLNGLRGGMSRADDDPVPTFWWGASPLILAGAMWTWYFFLVN
jgi:hypothetical protein